MASRIECELSLMGSGLVFTLRSMALTDGGPISVNRYRVTRTMYLVQICDWVWW